MERKCFRMLVPLMILALHAMLHAQTGALHGTLAGFGGAPLTDATVRVGDSAYFRSADLVDGAFIIPDPAPGIYTVDLWAPGFIAEQYEITIRAGYSAHIAMTLCPRPGGTMSVVIPRVGHRRSNASISPDDVQRSARTSIRSAVALNSGVTTAGVNGIAMWGYGGVPVELIPEYEPIELPQCHAAIGDTTAASVARDPVVVVGVARPDELLGQPDTSSALAPTLR